jgi:hypothetical protein
MSTTLVVGLDLGQVNDPSALVAVEWKTEGEPGHGLPRVTSLDVRHVQRWRLGSSYPDIVEDVGTLMKRPQLQGAILVIDGTGVGRAVVDLFLHLRGRAFSIIPVSITSGEAVSYVDGYWHVPKRDLVGIVQVKLQGSMLRWPSSTRMPDVGPLMQELQNFQYKITTAGNTTYGAWREGTNDDLVLALALAVWYGETRHSQGIFL